MASPIQPEDVPANLVDAVHVAAMRQGLAWSQRSVRQMAALVLAECSDLADILDSIEHDDGDSAEGLGIVAHMGELVVDACPRCAQEQMLTGTIHGLGGDGLRVIGAIAVCHGCGWAPLGEPDDGED
ncbi:hypothetical protein ACIBEJ_00430 [Nonomuraea sp. NPDC050790]|uniref:hypothetical protein n=1 Tax=Nonomuraea sp. NPDC050790 TaxID=3364371 RepID=UPI0037AC5888